MTPAAGRGVAETGREVAFAAVAFTRDDRLVVLAER